MIADTFQERHRKGQLCSFDFGIGEFAALAAAMSEGAAAAGTATAGAGALGAVGAGAAEAGLGAGSALMAAAPTAAELGAGALGATEAAGSLMPAGMGLIPGIQSGMMPLGMVNMPEGLLAGGASSLAAPAANVSLAQTLSEPSLLAKLGLDTPKNLVSATNQGIDTLSKLRAMGQNRSPYVVAPNLHPGSPTQGVKLASAIQRKSTPLEEFALLLRRAGM